MVQLLKNEFRLCVHSLITVNKICSKGKCEKEKTYAKFTTTKMKFSFNDGFHGFQLTCSYLLNKSLN